MHKAKRSLTTGKISPDMTMVQVQRKAMAENRGENTSLKITKVCSTTHETEKKKGHRLLLEPFKNRKAVSARRHLFHSSYLALVGH